MTAGCPVCGSEQSRVFSTARDKFETVPGRIYTVIRCCDCGLGWTDPRIPDEELASYYPSGYLGETARLLDDLDAGRWKGTASWRMEKEKADLLERFCGRGSILDVGCGEGKFLWSLDPVRWKRAGIEISAATVELIRDRVPGIELQAGTLNSVELCPGSFDVVTFWHVLEHMNRPDDSLVRAASLLKPGGWVIVSLPNIESYQADWFRSDWYAFGDVPRHVFHFSPNSLMRLMLRSGIKPVKVEFFSKAVNFHMWKHSLRDWLKTRLNTDLLYFPAKPLLHILPLLERITQRYGVMTVIGRTPEKQRDSETY